MEGKKIILIIDDDVHDRFFFKNAVGEINASYECLEAAGGAEGLELLGSTTTLPHFIFLDLNMPRMNGLECLHAIKQIPHLAHIPVVIYSTSDYYKDVALTRSLGVAAFLTKTPDLKTLPAAIIKAMEEAEQSLS